MNQTLENLKLLGYLNTPSLFLEDQFEGIDILKLPKDALTHQEIKNFTCSESSKIGITAEQYLKYVLIQYYGAELLADNHVIKSESDGRTLGEMDFLLKLAEIYYHIETTYKIYLYRDDIDPSDPWIGPNIRDRLSNKLSRLITHQLPILETLEAYEQLRKIGIQAESVKQQIHFKAQLFIPYEKDYILEDWINPECIAGYWMNYDSWKTFKEEYRQYAIIEKANWFVSVSSDTNSYFSKYLKESQEEIQDLYRNDHVMMFVQTEKGPIKVFVNLKI